MSTTSAVPQPEPRVLCSAHLWAGFEEAVRKPETAAAPSGAQAILHKLSDQSKVDICQVLAAVRGKQCTDCSFFDDKGTLDPVDGGWRCRFCWEHMLLDAALRDPDSMLMPLHELETLKTELGSFFVPGGRQRWSWQEGDRYSRWIEFRPSGVLWHSHNQVGSWEQWMDRGRLQLAIHLVNWTRDGQRLPEVRYLFALSHNPSPHFQEYSCENFRPLGFAPAERRHKERAKVALHPTRRFQPAPEPVEPVKQIEPSESHPEPEPTQAKLTEPPVVQNGLAHFTVSCTTQTEGREEGPETDEIVPCNGKQDPCKPPSTARKELAYALGR